MNRGSPNVASIGATEPAPNSALERQDRIDELLHQTQGIVRVIGAASTSNDRPADDAILAAAWAVADMLGELKTLQQAAWQERCQEAAR